jgi:ATP-binding cassette subfamily B protein
LPGCRRRPLPAAWSAQLASQLAGDEAILAWLEIDLDATLRFASGILVVSSERLLALSATTAVAELGLPAGTDLSAPRPFRRRDAGTLRHRFPVGALALHAGRRHRRRTAGRPLHAAAHLPVTGKVPPPSTLALCPKCETPLLAGQEECPVCSKEIHEPPSTWTLLRLGRFARPYKGQLLPASCSPC